MVEITELASSVKFRFWGRQKREKEKKNDPRSQTFQYLLTDAGLRVWVGDMNVGRGMGGQGSTSSTRGYQFVQEAFELQSHVIRTGPLHQ